MPLLLLVSPVDFTYISSHVKSRNALSALVRGFSVESFDIHTFWSELTLAIFFCMCVVHFRPLTVEILVEFNWM